jgi:hypothetical protein
MKGQDVCGIVCTYGTKRLKHRSCSHACHACGVGSGSAASLPGVTLLWLSVVICTIFVV